MSLQPHALVAIIVIFVTIGLAGFVRALFWLVSLAKRHSRPVVLDLYAGGRAAVKGERSAENATEPVVELGLKSRSVLRIESSRDAARVAAGRRRALQQLAEEEALALAEAPTDPGILLEKSLNAFFNYNGHTFDAYEVLGLPAGSPIEAARLAFTRAARELDPESLPFLETALRAIERHR